MQLPEAVELACAPLFDAFPLDTMLEALVPTAPGPAEAVRLVSEISAEAVLAPHPPLVAGLWLYVDELDKSHVISQELKDKTGSFWHGIMHRREGDFWNAKYWFDRCGAHAAMMPLRDYDPFVFVDKVEAAHRDRSEGTSLVKLQRREWASLFEWCARQSIQE